MKRESGQDQEEIKQAKQETTERDQEGPPDKRPKYTGNLDTSDLGAGYDCEDKKVVKALKVLEKKLLPYVEENSSIFRQSNFIALKGYATSISPESHQ